MSFVPSFNVWTRSKGHQPKWVLHHTTETLSEALAWFTQLDAEGEQVAIYELGSFIHEGEEVEGQVGFWWSASLNDYMTRAPMRRGLGWTEDFDTWVEYRSPPLSSPADIELWGELAVSADQELAQSPEYQEVALEPEERYVEVPCEHCGLILPMNQLHRLTHDVRTGGSSGFRSTSGRSSRQGTSRSQRGATFSSSSGSRSSSSASNRTYYKTETLVLCADCYAKQDRADHPILTFLRKLVE